MKTSRFTVGMATLVLMLLALIGGTADAAAQYSIYSFAGDVTIKHAGKEMAAANDMKITAADRIIVGANSSVQILNARDSRLYACTTQGEHTLSGIMLDAESESNSSTLHRRMRMGKGEQQEGTMYVEKGKVTRALATFDPEAQGVQTDPEALARFIASTLAAGEYRPSDFPATFGNTSGVFGFHFANTGNEPLYINIIKVDNSHPGEIDVSELGQPVGSYVILPGQTLARTQEKAPDSLQKHILIATHYYFSIDDLVEALRSAAATIQDGPVPIQPVFVAYLEN
ncbi:MAG: hypothetical protein K2K69_01925 [Muribaculaceae bacterium]|nr:hypothetical protein [Muribaculaceae bacterium]